MLRVLITTGALLMLVGFGAAGWQYWTGPPATGQSSRADAVQPGAVGDAQAWLISPSGGLVRPEDVRAFLEQGKFVPDRLVEITEVAALSTLLADGEKLPDAPYLEVLADIRAPMIAQDLCPVMTATVAETCAIHAARVVRGSVDPIMGTAAFKITLVYRQKPPDTALPDLASHVLRTQTVAPFAEAEPAPDATEGETGETDGVAEAPVLPENAGAALADLLQAVVTTCAEDDRLPTCRLLRVSLDWAPGVVPTARAEVAWLAPLPDGITAAPTLGPLPEG